MNRTGAPRLRHGTSGFAYSGWKGSFYPSDMSPDGMLPFYAARFPAVEINSTFYRMPREHVLREWADRVPDRFMFVLKATRWITHTKRLREAAEPLAILLENSSPLGRARGPFLFQLPPNMKKDAARLSDFLALLPEGVRTAFEFRNQSWFDDEIRDLLHNAGCALVVADSADECTPRDATADWGYLRLRRDAYSDADLADWAAWIHDRPWTDAFAFFKHEDEGAGPRLAERFAALYDGRSPVA